jgi:hypothetical protein
MIGEQAFSLLLGGVERAVGAGLDDIEPDTRRVRDSCPP